jgi:hypothetical protein
MQVTDGSGGLCLTCNNAPTCYYRATRGPALFCELFDNYLPPPELGGGKPVPRTDASTALRAAEEEAGKFTGLCMNCGHRATCQHPRPVGGVWHCEDYE